MMRQHGQQPVSRTFTAGEVAEFAYCPLAWWHEHYDPIVQAETEDLFAYLVDLEHEHDIHATALPEYQVIEQLLVRRGAFDEGQQQDSEHAEDVAELEQESMSAPNFNQRRLMVVVIVMLMLALLLMIASFALALR